MVGSKALRKTGHATRMPQRVHYAVISHSVKVGVFDGRVVLTLVGAYNPEKKKRLARRHTSAVHVASQILGDGDSVIPKVNNVCTASIVSHHKDELSSSTDISGQK